MERDPFTDARGLGPRGPEPIREENWREIARQQAEIRSRRARLEQRVSELVSERYTLEGRAEREWRKLSREARHVASEQHRVLGNELRGVLREKEALREREAQLDELAASARQANRVTERVRDRETWKAAGVGLEGRLEEREAQKSRRDELIQASQERRDALPSRGALGQEATHVFPHPEKKDREIEL